MSGGATNHQGEAALREMDHGRVEISTLVECRDDDGGRKACRDLRESIMSAVEAPSDGGGRGVAELS